MKNLSKLFVLLPGLILCACNEKNENEPQSDPNAITCILQQAETKSSLDGMNVNWNAGDQIKIYNAQTDSGKVYTLVSGAGTRKGVFTTDDPILGDGPFTAIYPASIAVGAYPNIQVKVPGTQEYVENSFGPGANISVALVEGKKMKELSFQNVCGILKLTVKGDKTIKSIDLKSSISEAIYGDCFVNRNGDLNISDALGNNTITLDCGENGVPLTAQGVDFYICLPRLTLSSGFTIFIYDTDDDYMKLTGQKGSEYSIGSSTIHPMPAVDYIPD